MFPLKLNFSRSLNFISPQGVKIPLSYVWHFETLEEF